MTRAWRKAKNRSLRVAGVRRLNRDMFSYMGKPLAVVAAIALTLSCFSVSAQQNNAKKQAKAPAETKTTTSSQGQPAAKPKESGGVPDIAPPQAPADDQQTGMMSGNKPFSLTTATDGELLYNFDEEKKLDSITAKKGVEFKSEDMSLQCDQLDFKMAKSELQATGGKVVVRMGDVIATCQLFKYYAETQRSELSGNPLLYNKTKDGKVSYTAGDKIEINTVNGKPQVKVRSGSGRRNSMTNNAVESVAAPGTGPVPTGTSALMSMSEGTQGGGAKGAAAPMMSGQSRAAMPAAASPGSSSSGSGLLGMPTMGGDTKSEAPKAAPSSNRIDVNNPQDLQSLSGR